MKNFTKYLLLASTLIALNFTSFGHEPSYQPGTENYLLVKRGFKIFKLGDPINKYSKYVRLVTEDKINEYEVIDKDLLSVGKDIILKKIVIHSKNGLITNIYVLLDSKYNKKFLATLIAAYGMSKGPDIILEAYLWTTVNKAIELAYYDKYDKDNSLAIFSLDEKV